MAAVYFVGDLARLIFHAGSLLYVDPARAGLLDDQYEFAVDPAICCLSVHCKFWSSDTSTSECPSILTTKTSHMSRHSAPPFSPKRLTNDALPHWCANSGTSQSSFPSSLSVLPLLTAGRFMLTTAPSSPVPASQASWAAGSVATVTVWQLAAPERHYSP